MRDATAVITVEIKNRYSGEVQIKAKVNLTRAASDGAKIGAAVLWAVANSANLSGADLSGAYLSGADLSRANLSGANLSRANLSGADLSRAYLSGADLSGADLSRANLSGANLSRANLSGANLSGANLSGANLSGADLSRADLSRADLSGADLSRANLSGANLSGANLSGANLSGADLSRAKIALEYLPPFQIPQEGALTVFKKTAGGIVKLEIPADAKRTASVIGRKCRAEFVKVLDAPVGAISQHDGRTTYVTGETVRPDAYDPNPLVECSNGIHFFLTREEAEAY